MILQPYMEVLQLHAPIAGERIFNTGAGSSADRGLARRTNVAITKSVARITAHKSPGNAQVCVREKLVSATARPPVT